MKEMHIYRGHEHFVINKKRNEKKEKVYEMIEEGKKSKEEKKGGRNK